MGQNSSKPSTVSTLSTSSTPGYRSSASTATTLSTRAYQSSASTATTLSNRAYQSASTTTTSNTQAYQSSALRTPIPSAPTYQSSAFRTPTSSSPAYQSSTFRTTTSSTPAYQSSASTATTLSNRAYQSSESTTVTSNTQACQSSALSTPIPSAPMYQSSASTTSTPRYQSSYNNHGTTGLNNHASASSYQQLSNQTEVTVGKENSASNNARVTQKCSTPIPSCTLNSPSSDNSLSNCQSEFRPRRNVSVRVSSAVPNNSSGSNIQSLQDLHPEVKKNLENNILTEKPVEIKIMLQKHESAGTNLADVGRNNLSSSTSTAQQSKDATSFKEEKKESNSNFIYPDLSADSLMLSDRNCQQNTTESGVSSNNRRQRIRNRRKPPHLMGRKNFRPVVVTKLNGPLCDDTKNAHSDFNVGSKAPEFTAYNNDGFSKNSADYQQRQKRQYNTNFNEKTFMENADVVLRMLNNINLKTCSDTTKLMLNKLLIKLVELHEQETNYGTSGEEVVAQHSQQKLELKDILKSVYSVSSRYRANEAPGETNDDGSDDGSSEEENDSGNKANVQHVFGTKYFCSACEQDLQGQAAAASHWCRGDCSSVTSGLGIDDAESLNGHSEVIQTDTQAEIKQMWREVNKAQKGRWYNIKHLKGSTYQCTTCDVNLDSTHNVINHVRQKGHQRLLAEKRAEETAENRIWRETPRALKFNRKYFVVIENGGVDVLVCTACVCEVRFALSDLVSHVTAKDHHQKIGKTKKN